MGVVLTDTERDELIAHYKRAIVRIRVLKIKNGNLTTQRYDSRGGMWVECKWKELHDEAIHLYRIFIVELVNGEYKPSEWYKHRMFKVDDN